MDKKQTISAILNEIEKVTNRAIDDGRAVGYTPLDLVCIVVQEMVQMAVEMQQMDKAFDDESDDGKGGRSV
jgi:hypothetical protein